MVARKQVFAVSKELGAQMWEDVQHPKKYLRKKASVEVLALYRVFCCFIDSVTQLSKQIAALNCIGTRKTYRIFVGLHCTCIQF